jgi:hypothetical protein
VSAAEKAVKRETIITGFRCCGYTVDTCKLKAQLQKALSKRPSGMLDANELVDYVDAHELNDDNLELPENADKHALMNEIDSENEQ